MRNLLAAANHRQRAMIAALVRTVFAQSDPDTARTQLRAVVDQLMPYAPTVAERLQAMEADLLAYTAFPAAHWPKIWSNNPSNGSTASSSAAPTSSASSPTAPWSSGSSARSSSRSTTR
jgi:transposase-like protein